ncbi:MAG: SDR family NAD(P)-dependent oxidoreductase, partial [Verrucomicrobiota bacterium]
MSKVALVTGGTRGIGLGISRALLAEGCDLVVNGVRDEEQVKDVLDELRAGGGRVHYGRADISQQQDRQRLLDEIREHFGSLHVLVNNAGIAPPVRNDILAMTEESYDRVMDVNLKASWFLTQAVANWMVEEGEGMIVNIGSISATVAS